MVDFLRSCYQTTILVCKEDLFTEIPIRWYFVDDTAKPLGFPTVFASHNWLDKSWETAPGLGETPGAARPWVDGSPPPSPSKGVPCGSPDVFLNGTPTALVPPYTSPSWGEPPCCFQTATPDCPILTRINPRSGELLYGLSSLICCLYGGNNANQDDVANAMTRIATANARMFRPGSILPSWVAYWDGRQALVAITGVVNIRQLLMEALSALVPVVPAGGYGVSSFILAIGHQVQQELYAAGLPMNVPILFTGHSFGGSVATYLGIQEGILRPAREVRTYTFGEPKSMNNAGAALAVGKHFRFQGEDDFVCDLPPDLTGVAILIGSVGSLIFHRWLTFVPSSEGLQINSDGTLVNSSTQGLPFSYVVGVIDDFLNGGTINISQAHAMSVYVQRFSLLCHNNPLDLPQRCFDVPAIDAVMSTNPCAANPTETDLDAGGKLAVRGSAPIALKGFLLAGGNLALAGTESIRVKIPLDARGALAARGAVSVLNRIPLKASGTLAERGTAPIASITSVTLDAGGRLAIEGTAPMANAIRIVAGGGYILAGHSIVNTRGNVLDAGGKFGMQGSAPILQQTTLEFTASTTFAGVSGVSQYLVRCWAAGGCGSLASGLSHGVSGGGGGAYAESNITVATSAGFAIVVGANANDGSDGGDTYVGDGSQCFAAGGKGPGEGIFDTTTGCAGGLAADSVGNVVTRDGGNGADDQGGGQCGGGGGAAGPQGPGNNSTDGTGGGGGGDHAGDGGDGAAVGTGAGEDGASYGGGGGGTADVGVGVWSAGGAGFVQLVYSA